MSSSADPARAARVLRGERADVARPADLALLATPAELARLHSRLLDEAGPHDELPSAADEIARARAEGHAEGHAAGYAEGFAAALAAAGTARAQALELAAHRLAVAAEAAATTRASLVAEVADEAVELTYSLARTILGDESVAAALPVREAVARALRLAPEGADLVVRVPASCELTAADLAGLCDTDRISVRTDASIDEGGCVVEAGACRIDAQISSALERVRTVLGELRATAGPPAPDPQAEEDSA